MSFALYLARVFFFLPVSRLIRLTAVRRWWKASACLSFCLLVATTKISRLAEKAVAHEKAEFDALSQY